MANKVCPHRNNTDSADSVLTQDQMTANINLDTDFTVDIRAGQR